jgi:hypothetical protein
MNGLGNYVKTRDAFFQIERMSFADWKEEHTVGGLAKCRLTSLGFRSGRSPNPTGVANGMGRVRAPARPEPRTTRSV